MKALLMGGPDKLGRSDWHPIELAKARNESRKS